MQTLNRVSPFIYSVKDLTRERVIMRDAIRSAVQQPGTHARLPRDYATLERLYNDGSGAKWLRLTSDAESMRERVSGAPSAVYRLTVEPALARALTARGVQLAD